MHFCIINLKALKSIIMNIKSKEKRIKLNINIDLVIVIIKSLFILWFMILFYIKCYIQFQDLISLRNILLVN